MTVPPAILACPVRRARPDFIGCVLSQAAVALDPPWARVSRVSVTDTAACATPKRPYARIVSITLLVIFVNDVLLDTTVLSRVCQMTVSHAPAL